MEGSHVPDLGYYVPSRLVYCGPGMAYDLSTILGTPPTHLQPSCKLVLQTTRKRKKPVTLNDGLFFVLYWLNRYAARLCVTRERRPMYPYALLTVFVDNAHFMTVYQLHRVARIDTSGMEG